MEERRRTPVRSVSVERVREAVRVLLAEACSQLPAEVVRFLEAARFNERSEVGRRVREQLLENARLSAETRIPLCQDTGLAVVMLEVGQDVHFTEGDLATAVDEGVRQARAENHLRASVVERPSMDRVNTSDNTPAVLHVRLVPGDRVRVIVLPKGGGAENKSALAMLEPSQGREGVVGFVTSTVERAGPSACPPLIVGVGVGGTFEYAALLAKEALLRPLGRRSPEAHLADVEREIMDRCNALGIGPMGFGGSTTVADVFVEERPAHIASLPVAVNIQCHSARSRETVI